MTLNTSVFPRPSVFNCGTNAAQASSNSVAPIQTGRARRPTNRAMDAHSPVPSTPSSPTASEVPTNRGMRGQKMRRRLSNDTCLLYASSPAGRGFRDLELEAKVFKLTQDIGIGAQSGGKYVCHDVGVVLLPRHGASLPIAIAVSCSADRQCRAKITAEGAFIEQLEFDPGRFLPDITHHDLAGPEGASDDHQAGSVVHIDLTQPMDAILAELSKHPVKTRLSLTGPLIVGRDIAHATIKERLDAGEDLSLIHI